MFEIKTVKSALIHFGKLKVVLQSAQVLSSPNFNKALKTTVDASDVGAGSVLIHDDNDVNQLTRILYR